MKRILCIALSLVALVATVPTTAMATNPADVGKSLAWFEDHWIDLAVDWEDATACDVGPDLSICFRTEAELDDYLGSASRSGAAELLSTCGSTLRLYDGTSYSGTVISLSIRNTTHNLSSYGFDNRTSSYRVGACDTDFFSLSNLGGSVYSGNTSAYAQSSSMLSGWNNVVSSVYIY